MDKNTYLKELDRHLARWMPEQERKDILRWYEEYFQEAGPEREAEVMAELGSPEALSRRLEEEGVGSRAGKPSFAWLGMAAVALVMLAVICVGIYKVAGLGRGDGSHAGPPSISGDSSRQPPYSSDGSGEQPPAVFSSNDGSAQAVEEFGSLRAQLALGDVTVRAGGTEFLVEVECRGTVDGKPYRIEYWVEKGSLRVESVPKNLHGGAGCEAHVTVTVPESWELEKLEVSVGMGNAELSAQTAQKVKLETGMGDLEWDGRSAGEVTMRSGMGDLEFRGAPAEEMELEAGMGAIRIRLDCASGECSYDLSAGMGKVSVDGRSQGKEAEQDPDGATGSLKATSGMGEITLTFQK